jgi:hypothetical protein
VEIGKAAGPVVSGSGNGPRLRSCVIRAQPGIREWSRKPNGPWKLEAGARSGRPGTLTLEWASREADLFQESERPTRATDPEAEQAAASFKALIQVESKATLGEQRGEAPGDPFCSAQCRACRRWAKLGIRSLGTFFFLRPSFCGKLWRGPPPTSAPPRAHSLTCCYAAGTCDARRCAISPTTASAFWTSRSASATSGSYGEAGYRNRQAYWVRLSALATTD